MVNTSEELAMEGKKVYLYPIGNFTTLCCIEQIRNDICYHKADVTVLTAGGGFAYGSLGMSHHATEDISMMQNLPEILYIGDAVQGLLVLLEKECADGAYNFASGDCRELKEFVEEMRHIAQSESLLEYGSVPYPESGMVTMHPSAEKLRRETGWKPEVTFAQGVREIVNVLKKEGKV